MNLPIRELFSSFELLPRQPRRRNLRDLVERRGDRGVAALGLDGQADDERPGDVRGGEARVDPVGQALGVAHAHAQARSQRGLAERGVGERAGEVRRVMFAGVSTGSSDHDVGAGLVRHDDRSRPGEGAGTASAGNPAFGPGAQDAEALLQAVQDPVGGDVADDDE